MATVYLADNYSSEPTPEGSSSGIVVAKAFVFTITAAFVTNDTIKLCVLPGSFGIEFLGWRIEVPSLDSSTGLVLQLGDSTSATRFCASSTVGRSSTAGRISSEEATVGAVLGSTPCTYKPDGTATNGGDDNLILKIQTQASGTAATSGAIIGWAMWKQYGVTPPTFGNEP